MPTTTSTAANLPSKSSRCPADGNGKQADRAQMTAEVHLCVDVGGTASRWTACAPDGTVLRTGSGAGASGHVFNPAEKLKFFNVLEGLRAELAVAELTPVSFTAGLPGYGTPAAAELRQLTADTLHLDPAAILFIDDISLAYL